MGYDVVDCKLGPIPDKGYVVTVAESCNTEVNDVVVGGFGDAKLFAKEREQRKGYKHKNIKAVELRTQLQLAGEWVSQKNLERKTLSICAFTDVHQEIRKCMDKGEPYNSLGPNNPLMITGPDPESNSEYIAPIVAVTLYVRKSLKNKVKARLDLAGPPSSRAKRA